MYLDSGMGAAGLIWWSHFHFSLINGKDGLSIGPFNTTTPKGTMKKWIRMR
jgi:hypothetical protein